MSDSLSHLERLESESIHFRREAVTEARRPVMLFSGSKDSTVMAHLALRAFHPASPPSPLLHNGYDLNFGGQAIVAETPGASASERRGRVSDRDGGSPEEQKRQGYF